MLINYILVINSIFINMIVMHTLDLGCDTKLSSQQKDCYKVCTEFESEKYQSSGQVQTLTVTL